MKEYSLAEVVYAMFGLDLSGQPNFSTTIVDDLLGSSESDLEKRVALCRARVLQRYPGLKGLEIPADFKNAYNPQRFSSNRHQSDTNLHKRVWLQAQMNNFGNSFQF
ncbi:MAG TPA: hypothetical protein VD907_01125 [Verrucomicrobiae bacterium]|nr:hypothetical protein [Verrucomicrobiae bacterium]